LSVILLVCCLYAVIEFVEGDHPTTHAPTTHAPTTKAPTTHAPTTKAPTTKRPTSPPHHGGRPHRPPHPGFPDSSYTTYELGILNITRTLYQGLVYPNAHNIVDSGSYPAGIFSPNVSGRIVPVGAFDDQEGTFEYFYGLAGGSFIIDVAFIHLFAKGNLVAVRVDLLFNQTKVPVDAAAGIQNLTQEGFITFNRDGLIESYDLVILRLGQAQFAVENPVLRPAVIAGICQVHQIYCLGANQQYANTTECINSITSQNYGTWDNASSNTTTCRELHSALVPLRPNFHCPHIGPTGGGACIDVPYNEFYAQNY